MSSFRSGGHFVGFSQKALRRHLLCPEFDRFCEICRGASMSLSSFEIEIGYHRAIACLPSDLEKFCPRKPQVACPKNAEFAMIGNAFPVAFT